MKRPNKPRPAAKRKVEIQLVPPTREEKAEFKRLHNIVRKGVMGFIKAGEALKRMQDGKLWRAGGFKTWEDYCRSVAGMSPPHAHRLMKASQCVIELQAVSDFSVWPESESQVRQLLRLENIEDRQYAWDAAVDWARDTQKTEQPTAEAVSEIVTCIQEGGYEGENIREIAARDFRSMRSPMSRSIITAPTVRM